MKDNYKNKELSYFKCWYLNNLYRWAMSQKLPVNNFVWIDVLLNLMKILYRVIAKRVIKNIFLRYPKNLHNLQNDLPFLRERMKIEKG